MGKLSARLKLGAVGVSALALTAGGLLATAGAASAAPVPTNFISLPYGPGGGPAHTLAMDVLGQNHSNGAQVVSWQSDEYQNVNGRIDPAEQFVVIPVTAATGGFNGGNPFPLVHTGVAVDQLEWAPGGVLSGMCVDDQSTSSHTHAVMEPCANGTWDVAFNGHTAAISGSQYQDFIYDQTSDNTNQNVSAGFGELEPVIGNIILTPTPNNQNAPSLTVSGVKHHQTALNDSAWANGGHVISWPKNSANNEEWNLTRVASS